LTAITKLYTHQNINIVEITGLVHTTPRMVDPFEGRSYLRHNFLDYEHKRDWLEFTALASIREEEEADKEGTLSILVRC